MEEGRGKAGRLMPSPAMVVALLALFVALGGSAWAVSKVGTKQIRNGAVTGPKIKNGAVTTGKIKGGAVNASRLANGAVTGVKLAVGAVTGTKLGVRSVGAAALADQSVGPAAIQSDAVGTESLADSAVTAAKLADGAVQGSNISITAVNGTPVSIPAGTSEIAFASCPEGRTAVSSGYEANSAAVLVYQDFVAGGTALIYAANPAGSSGPVQVTAQAVCI
jgi:hypothetical protein